MVDASCRVALGCNNAAIWLGDAARSAVDVYLSLPGCSAGLFGRSSTEVAVRVSKLDYAACHTVYQPNHHCLLGLRDNWVSSAVGNRVI